jgi:ATP-binding cassette subfamily F protein 3
MDEPGTHLDIPSTDALIAALNAYEGTLIFISHDVYLIRAIANRVLHIDAGRLTPYHGDYDYYLDKSRATDARAALVSGGRRPALTNHQPGLTTAPKNESAAARTGPKTREQRQAELTAQLEAPATYAEPGKPVALNREVSGIIDRLHAATGEWEAAAGELEALEKR